MKYVLILLLFTGFFAQAEMEESYRSTGFFVINVGVAVDTKLTQFNYPTSISYGGNILKDRYVGDFEVGLAFYREDLDAPIHLLFKYAYDFMVSSSDWGLGVDTTLYLGGDTTDYKIDKDGNVTEDSGRYGYEDNGSVMDAIESKQGVNFYIGHDLGLFVKKRIVSQSLLVLLRLGVNNALVMKPRFFTKEKEEEEIKVVSEWFTPNIYLSTGFQWYF